MSSQKFSQQSRGCLEIMPEYDNLVTPSSPNPATNDSRITQKMLSRISSLSMLWALFTMPLTNGIQGIGKLVRIREQVPELRQSFGSALNSEFESLIPNPSPIRVRLSEFTIVNLRNKFGPMLMSHNGKISVLRGGFTPKRGKKSKSKRKPLSLKYKIQKRILSVSNSRPKLLPVFISSFPPSFHQFHPNYLAYKNYLR